MVGPVGAAVDPRIPSSTARILAGKIRPNGSSVSQCLSAGDRATVIAPSKCESSRKSVETASGKGPTRTRRRACWTARSSNGRRTPGGGRTREMKAGEPAGSISRSSTRRASRTGFARWRPGRECSRRAPVQREDGGGCICGGGGFLDQGQPASAHGVGASQSARSVRVSSRRSCTSSLCVGLPQYQ
jgi:hypothetical protein